jgi:transglutaminase-like putative cysteine protease
MKYRVRHRTTYVYAAPADTCHNVLRLAPRTLTRQTCVEHAIDVDPAPLRSNVYFDYFGNQVRSFALYAPHSELLIDSRSVVEVNPPSTTTPPDSPAWETCAAALRTERDEETVDALQYVFDSPYIRTSERLFSMARMTFIKGRPLLQATMALTRFIHREFKFDPTATTIDTSIETVLEKRRGVCQDFAHLQIGCLRSLGLACRYVSGYLRTDPAPGQQRLEGADASHAWISVYSPDHGWCDFDPTNGCMIDERHITIGWGRDFHDISPVKGVVLGGGASRLSVAVDVIPIEDAVEI